MLYALGVYNLLVGNKKAVRTSKLYETIYIYNATTVLL